MRRVPCSIVGSLLAVLVFLAATARAEEPAELVLGREIVFLRPVGGLGAAFSRFTLAFDLVKRRESEDVTRPVRAYPPLVRAVREYREFVERRKGAPVPLFVALGEDLEGTAYCMTQPAIVRAVDGKGRARTLPVIGPIIHLSKSDLARIRSSAPDGPAVLCHEIGHAFMVQAHGLLDFPGESPEHAVQLVSREGHWYTKETDPVFAYTEGWAEYTQCRYVGSEPSPRLIRLPAGTDVKAGDQESRLMTAAEIRRHEGAQAYLLFHLERALGRHEFYRELLDVMAADRPRTLNGLLRAYAVRHPDRKEEVDRALQEVSHGAFEVDYSYTRDDLKDETRGSWERLQEAVRKRLGGK